MEKPLKTNKNRDFFYCIFTSDMRDRHIVASWFLRRDILDFAEMECSKTCESLEELAKIPWDDEKGEYSRKMTEEEYFEAALEKLRDDRRVFLVFPDTEQGIENFIHNAELYNVQDQARDIL